MHKRTGVLQRPVSHGVSYFVFLFFPSLLATSTVCLDVQGTTTQSVGPMDRPTQTSVCSAFRTGTHLIGLLTFPSPYASKIFTPTPELTDSLVALDCSHWKTAGLAVSSQLSILCNGFYHDTCKRLRLDSVSWNYWIFAFVIFKEEHLRAWHCLSRSYSAILPLNIMLVSSTLSNRKQERSPTKCSFHYQMFMFKIQSPVLPFTEKSKNAKC